MEAFFFLMAGPTSMAWDFRRKSVERVVKEAEAEAEDEAAPLEGAEVEQEEEE